MIASNKTKPLSKVLKKEASSSLITFSISCFCAINSGKASPIFLHKTSVNLYIKGSFLSKNVNPYLIALRKILRIT